MKTNQLHINLSKCAHMYFIPNLHYKERLSCARTTGYDQGFSLSVNGQKVKKADKVKFLGVIIDENLRGRLQRTSAKISNFQTTPPPPLVRVCPNFQNHPPSPDVRVRIFQFLHIFIFAH